MVAAMLLLFQVREASHYFMSVGNIHFSMRKALVILILVANLTAKGQSRIFISAGAATSLGGTIDTFLASNRTAATIDAEYEKKIIGTMSVLTGVSWYGVGYKYDGTGFASNSSSFSANYLAVPVMARWNMVNKNMLHLDFGIVTSWMAQAHLTENYTRFGFPQKADGDIAAYSNRLLIGAKFQETILLNRFTLTLYYMVTFKGQNTVKNLPEHWPLNQQQSPYLQSNGYSDYSMLGFRVGLQLK